MSKKAFVVEDQEIDTQEEAHFFKVLSEFAELVKTYGMEEIMVNIDEGAYADMFDFFVPMEAGDEYGN